MSSSGGLRRAWQIHGVVLAALVVFYLWVCWDIFTGPPRGGVDFAGAAAVILGVVLFGYVLLSSVLMLWIGRRVWGPIVMHGLAISAYVINLAEEQQRDHERAMAATRHELEAQRWRDCIELRDLRVVRGTPLRASIYLYSGCAVPVAVERVDLRGDAPDGLGVRLDTDLAAPTTLAPQRGATFVLESLLPSDSPVADGWRWQVHVRVVEPEYESRCFATPGLAAPACGPLGRVTLTDS